MLCLRHRFAFQTRNACQAQPRQASTANLAVLMSAERSISHTQHNMTHTQNTFAELEDSADKADNFFGPMLSCYTRAQAIADGVLVDFSQSREVREAGIRYPLAMSRASYESCIAAGGEWVPEQDGSGDILELPAGQSSAGRLWDVLTMLRHAIRSASGSTDRVTFSVLVDVNGDGKHRTVRLWSLVGPGDTAAPVITIMLEGED